MAGIDVPPHGEAVGVALLRELEAKGISPRPEVAFLVFIHPAINSLTLFC